MVLRLSLEVHSERTVCDRQVAARDILLRDKFKTIPMKGVFPRAGKPQEAVGLLPLEIFKAYLHKALTVWSSSEMRPVQGRNWAGHL